MYEDCRNARFQYSIYMFLFYNSLAVNQDLITLNGHDFTRIFIYKIFYP